MRKREDDIIRNLVTKYNYQKQRGWNHELMADGMVNFYTKNETETILLTGDFAYITPWGDVWSEIPEDLLKSCNLKIVTDDYAALNYG